MTFTVAVAELVLPNASSPVRVTVWIPKSLQSKFSLSKLRDKLQLSEEPLSISLIVIFALPLLSR